MYEPGNGTFKIEKELFSDLEPMQHYYPQEISNSHLGRLLALQKAGCEKSISHLRCLLEHLEL